MRSRSSSVWLGLACMTAALGVGREAPAAEWGVLGYLSGDGSLEPVVLEYARRLAEVPGTQRVSIALQIDRGPGFSSGGDDWEDARRAVLAGGDPGRPRRWEWSGWRAEVDMGDPGTLVEFLEWGAQAAPAERYLVLLVGHGSGVRPFVEEAGPQDHGVAYDATSNGDSLTPGELRAAGPAIIEALGGKRIALLALDACFSASAEMAVEAGSSAEVMTGSPNLLYDPGVPWEKVLGRVCETGGLSAEAVGRLAVEAVEAEQAATGHPRGSYSAARLTGAAEFGSRLKTLSDELCVSMREAAPAVTAARARTRRGGLSEEMLDAGGFLQALAEEAEARGLTQVAVRAEGADEAFGGMVLASFSSEEDGPGGAAWTWSIFFPPNLTAFPADYLTTGRFARESGWGAFLEAYLGHLERLSWGN